MHPASRTTTPSTQCNADRRCEITTTVVLGQNSSQASKQLLLWTYAKRRSSVVQNQDAWSLQDCSANSPGAVVDRPRVAGKTHGASLRRGLGSISVAGRDVREIEIESREHVCYTTLLLALVVPGFWIVSIILGLLLLFGQGLFGSQGQPESGTPLDVGVDPGSAQWRSCRGRNGRLDLRFRPHRLERAPPGRSPARSSVT